MVQVRYDEDLVEEAVFFCARSLRPSLPPLQVVRFQREREKLYRILDPDARNAAFFQLHLEWFREWGLDQPLVACLDEFPSLRQALNVLAVRKTVSRRDEGAELYVNGSGERTGLIALRTEWLAEGAALRDLLRHELTHLHDMVNPAFAYVPVLDLPGLNAAQRRTAQERYRLLWDVSIDGRLAARGHRPGSPREHHEAAFARAYAFWPESKRAEVFRNLWQDASPTHRELIALVSDPRGLRSAPGGVPGATCPLCDFPTFAWADVGDLPLGARERIAAEFPHWLPEHGLCNRCLESYQALLGTGLARQHPSDTRRDVTW